MNQLKDFIDDLAETCIEDGCSYEAKFALPQHVTQLRGNIYDKSPYQFELGEFLQDQNIGHIIACELLHGYDDDKDLMWSVLCRIRDTWLGLKLEEEVTKEIDGRLGGYIADDDVEIVDEWGGAL